MKRFIVLLLFCVGLAGITRAQITLSGINYSQNFDQAGAGIPNGWKIQTGATANTQGADQPLTTTATSWGTSSGGFYNLASADGLTASSNATDQNNSTDRALGVRQTAAFGDPGASFVLQLTNTTGFYNFSLQFKIQSLDAGATRSVNWVVDYGTGAIPASYTTAATTPSIITTGNSVWGTANVNVFFGNALNNINTPVWIRITTLSASTGSGTRPITALDDVSLNYTNSINVSPPLVASLFPANNAVNVQVSDPLMVVFDEAVIKGTGNITIRKFSNNSVVQTFNVNDPAITVNNGAMAFVPNPALDTNTHYYINIDAGAITDVNGTAFAGINDNSTWNFTTSALGPPIYTFDLNNCMGTLPAGLTRFNTAGDSVWNCTSSGYNGTNGVRINGFNNGVNEDWLIIPRLNLTGMSVPLLNFKCRTNFTGPQLKLMVSTNYSGTGNPNAATWTELNGNFPNVNSDTWDTANYADLSNWKTNATSIAWKYFSDPQNGASRWTVDDIQVVSFVLPYLAQVYTDPVYINMGYTPAGTVSSVKTFTFNASNFNNPLTVKGVKGFEISKDGTQFSDSTLLYTPAELLTGGKTVHVRFKPTIADTVYKGSIIFTNSNITWAQKPFLTGTSADYARSLDIVNWNIEWFGSPSNGPVNDDTQETNVKTALRYLDADIYAFEEVVDTIRFKRLADSMGSNYSYRISYFCSGATTPASGNYASGQKLGIIYNKNILTQVEARPFLYTSFVGYDNWASGRFPYLVTGNINLDGRVQPVEIYILHGKAGATVSDFQRRKNGVKEMKDSLDAHHPNAHIFIIGDFNDDLDQSIFAASPLSSYDDLIKDSTDNDSYQSISLELSRQGVGSTLNFPDVIDHQVVSNEVAPGYIGSSIALRTDIALAVPGFLTGNTTDHYPVYGRYLLRNVVTGVRDIRNPSKNVLLFPNPAKNRITLRFKPETGNLNLRLFDTNGKLLMEKNQFVAGILQDVPVQLPNLTTGMYYLKLKNKQLVTVKTILVN